MEISCQLTFQTRRSRASGPAIKRMSIRESDQNPNCFERGQFDNESSATLVLDAL